MKCQNCGENEANVRYTQIINGVKKEIALCDECSKKMGLESLDFNIPINFSSFLGEFIDNTEELIPSFMGHKALKCDKCGMTYSEFVDKGKFGCSNCYNVFANKVDTILKNIHGTSIHTGKKYKLKESKNLKKVEVKENKEEKESTEIEDLRNKLKKAIQEERYEDAARYRDEIRNVEKE